MALGPGLAAEAGAGETDEATGDDDRHLADEVRDHRGSGPSPGAVEDAAERAGGGWRVVAGPGRGAHATTVSDRGLPAGIPEL
ncbi:hypothetical protein GCM10023221_07770 [Luteimicrobium xylanilyticum]